jgi:hypothetical protein
MRTATSPRVRKVSISVLAVTAFSLWGCSGSPAPVAEAGAAAGGAPGAGGADAATGAGGMGGSGGATVGTGGMPGRADGAAGGVPDPQEVRFCNDLSRVQCDKLMACAPFALKVIFGDLKTCQDRNALACANQVAIPGSTVTPALETACVQALTNTSCEDYANGVPVAACDFKGGAANGAPCSADRQCMTGNCVLAVGQTCGTCAAFIPAGGPCGGVAICAPGLACIPSANGTGICGTLGKAGAPCRTSDGCSYGFYCNALTCAAQMATLGASCNAGDACNEAGELLCDMATLRCVQAKYATPGQTCDAITRCLAGADCLATTATATSGTCFAPANDGEACSQIKSCIEPAGCVAGACRLPVPAVCN